MEQAKAIQPVRPHEPKLAVNWVLDVWASAVTNQANLGSGDPEWKAIFAEPPPVPALGPTVPVCDRSDEMYDASPKKYERHPRSDVRVLYCASLVESATEGMPKVVVAYLLAKYPRNGCYAPQMNGQAWSEEPSKAFIERGACLGIAGFYGSGKDFHRFAKWLRRREREVKDLIRSQIEDEGGFHKKVSQACNFSRAVAV